MRALNLALTPIVAGFALAGIGSLRRRREQELIRLDTFAYGFCFSLSMALVRFVWGK